MDKCLKYFWNRLKIKYSDRKGLANSKYDYVLRLKIHKKETESS